MRVKLFRMLIEIRVPTMLIDSAIFQWQAPGIGVKANDFIYNWKFEANTLMFEKAVHL